MAAILIDVDIDESFAAKVSADCLRQIALDTLRLERPTEALEVDVVISDDAFLRELNRDYRHLDEPTDVLSFSLVEESLASDAPPLKFVAPPGVPVHLGEVIISYPTAVGQATQAGHSVEKELTTLLVHGILHLLGYDHAEPEEEKQMFSRQDQLVSQTIGCWIAA